MPLTLILVRHAKSEWGDPQRADHDRTLNGRGRAAAPAVGRWLAERGHLPDQVLVSTATRAVETWQGMADALGAPELSFHPRLYHAAPETMLGHLQAASGRCVLMIGHNPGIAAFAGALLRRPPQHPRFRDYPTAATLVAGFEIDDWADLEWHTGAAMDFIVPRALTG